MKYRCRGKKKKKKKVNEGWYGHGRTGCYGPV